MTSVTHQFRDSISKKMTPVVAWYEGREEREKVVLQLLAATVLILMFLSLVWMPAWSVRDDQMNQWQSRTKLLSWMQLNEAEIRARQQQSGKAPSAGNDWVAGLSRSAQAASVTIKSFSPEGGDGARIQLENQAFAATYRWLQTLAGQGIYVNSAEFLPGNDEGRVNLRASLSRQP